ncbi:hypothetical protein C1A50_2387 [Paenibacillus polymyxa]|nr:hypothetical protein C1A50_2387 [Paenibacillus polymyxa]
MMGIYVTTHFIIRLKRQFVFSAFLFGFMLARRLIPSSF